MGEKLPLTPRAVAGMMASCLRGKDHPTRNPNAT